MKRYILVTARNIINFTSIPNFIEKIIRINHVKNPIIKQWLEKQLKLYMMNTLESVKIFTEADLTDKDNLWIENNLPPNSPSTPKIIEEIRKGNALEILYDTQSIKKFEDNILRILSYFDELNEKELKKIYKLNFKSALDKTENYEKELKNLKSSKPDKNGINVIKKYPGGEQWVRLLTPKALDRETKLMNHCAGKGDYDYKVRKNESFVYSLRDSTGKSQCTIEVLRNSILNQIKGYEDGPIKEEFIPFVKDFIKNDNFEFFHKKFSSIHDLDHIGYININGTMLDANDIPENFTINGSLKYIPNVKLPNNLTIKGNLSVSNLSHPLPKGLKVEGELSVFSCLITELPNDIKVGSNIDLSYSMIEKLPDNFKVNGDLNLKDTSISVLPENLNIKGTLNISRTDIIELPDSVKYDRLIAFDSKIKKLPISYFLKYKYDNIDLAGTCVDELPDNLTVKNLNLSESKIDILKAKNLVVTNNLDLNFSTVASLPENITVGNDLDLRFTKNLKELPMLKKVGNDLILHNSKIKKLPDNLTVGGNLKLINCPIVKLPKNLTVGGDLNLDLTKVTRLPGTLKVFNLNARNSRIKIVESGIQIEQNMDLRHNPLESLPDNLKVKGTLDLEGTKIEILPNNLDVGELIIYYANITELPKGLKAGVLDLVKGNRIKELPSDIRIDDLYISSDLKDMIIPKGVKNVIITDRPKRW